MLEDIDELAKLAIEEHLPSLQREGLRPIHKKINCWYNSLNVFVGRQGTGKTYSAMTEIAKIAKASPETCQVLYITKDGTKCDETVEALKEIVDIPFVYLSEENAEAHVKKLQDWMAFYKGIQDGEIDWRKLRKKQLEEMYTVLKISSCEAPFLHVIILFEDFVNNKLVKKADSYFCNFIATLRHKGFSVFICIQFWKGLPVPIKSNTTTIFLFPGYSPQQLWHIFYQIPLQYTAKEMQDLYRTIQGNDKIIVNAITGSVKIDKAQKRE
jgi:hypothetical protein